MTGFLLAGIGESDVQNGENWLVVTNSKCFALPECLHSNAHTETPQQKIEDAFKKLTSRDDLTILLISQQVRIMFLWFGLTFTFSFAFSLRTSAFEFRFVGFVVFRAVPCLQLCTRPSSHFSFLGSQNKSELSVFFVPKCLYEASFGSTFRSV